MRTFKFSRQPLMGTRITLLLSVCLPWLSATASLAAAADEGPAFFEAKIRPVLVQQCYKCHSADAKKPKGNLRLDSRDGLRKGGESGPAVVPGKPNDSLLLKAIRYTDEELQMPPDGKKLPAAVIADFEKWIAMGAPDPRGIPGSVAGKTKGIDFAAARKHWAYQPIRKPDMPEVKDKHWANSLLDVLVVAKLEEKGLTPSPPADKRTLLRRVYFDLIGLPPTMSEVEAFERDASPEAFARVVDHLLSMPEYGERWGRHWLDVARYADTKDGVLQYGDDRIRPYAYTYRDYVIRAFNEDLPFDRFVHEQLAADQIEPKVEPWRLAGMGYLTLGRLFDNNIHDVLDDRIDVVTRGFLGLTVSCARCHDHKYDAISQKDYYSLYGVFASSEAPLELPVIGRTDLPGNAAFEKKARPKQEALQKFFDQQFDLLSEQARQRVGDYLLHVATTPPDPLETAIFFLSLAPQDLRPPIVARWRRYLSRPERAGDPVFGPWFEMMKLPEADFVREVPTVLKRWQGKGPGTAKGQLNPLVWEILGNAKLTGRPDLARVYGKLLLGIYQMNKGPIVHRPLEKELADSVKQVFNLVAGPDSPCYFPRSHTWQYMSRTEKDRFGQMQTELDRLAVQSPGAAARAMVLQDIPELYEPRVFVRGNPAQPGELVPRQFLTVLAGPSHKAFVHGSGRLDLARAITAPDNPLTSRVLVNRVWMGHFGEPLVATPSDYGTRSTPPANPGLLDWLAWKFQQDGWSLKKLHRLIVLSKTYQQASLDRPECRQVDPENRLLWRMNRQRLDFEAMRDTLLMVSGRLDRQVGGRPVDIVNNPANRRRTVYGLVDRQSLPGMYRAFDFAVPDSSVERRSQTTVPQQALFGLNSPFLIEQAKGLAARVEGSAPGPARVAALYRLVLTRDPEPGEVRGALRFIAEVEMASKGQQRSQLSAWQQYAQVLLLTNELMFVD
jgi:cytochrome c553